MLAILRHEVKVSRVFCFYRFQSNNCVQDAVILTTVTGLTSIYAAAVTYTIIGFRATDRYDNCISE